MVILETQDKNGDSPMKYLILLIAIIAAFTIFAVLLASLTYCRACNSDGDQ